MLTFAQTKEDLTYRQELEKIFHKVHLVYLPKWRSAFNCLAAPFSSKPVQVLYFRSAAMQAALQQVIENDSFDAVHVQHLRMSPYLAQVKELPRILDMPDAFSLYWKRRAKTERGFVFKLFGQIEQNRVYKYERIMKEYDLSLVCSAEDLNYLVEEHGIRAIKLLPNGVDLDTFSAKGHDYSHNHTLLFTGNMDYAPNVDAVGYFVQDILPLIKEKFPAVQFIIAGQRPVKKVQELAGPGVQVTGFVKDLAATYNSASVVVAPLRFGAGTQNKVLEGMAMGVPVVCSHIGFKGLGVENGDGVFMETEPTAFANRVIQLLESAELRKKTGTRALQNIRENFGWDVIAAMLEGYFSDITSK